MKRLMLLALAFAGCNGTADQYVVVLDSDLSYPGEIAQLEIAAYEQGTTAGDGTVLDLSDVGLPASVGVMPLDGDAPLVVLAQAMDASGTLVVARQVVLHERPDGLVRITMFLARSCRGVVCQQGETCTEMGCESAAIGGDQMRDIGEGEDLVDLCRPGEGSCNASGDGYTKCERYGGPEVAVACGAGEVCDPTTLECIDEGEEEEQKNGNTVTVTVGKVGAGAGHVHSVDYAVDCGTTCSIEVERGTSIDLRAVPDQASQFVGWEGDCSGTTCVFTANDDTTIDARFEPAGTGRMEQLQIDVFGSGSGTVRSMPNGIVCTAGMCSGSFPFGTVVTLTAEPNSGSALSTWMGDCSGRDVCTVRMDAPRWVSANFTWDDGGPNVNLDVFQGGTGFGWVSSDPVGIDCGAICNASFSRDSTVRLTATPEPGHQFIQWDGACSGTGDCFVDMATNMEVVAVFEDPSFQPAVPYDVNGDTWPDLVYGAPGAAGGSGAVYVSFGPRNNESVGAAAADRRYVGTQPGARFGTSVAVGDLDGDGYDDIAIGAPEHDGRGAVFVVFGGPGLIGSASLSPIVRGETSGSKFGSTVEIDDMDYDGIGELLVGAPSSGPTSFGHAYVFPGGPGFSPSITSAFMMNSDVPGDGFGTSIEVVGDIDLDGWPDVVVGAPKWGTTGDSRGRISLYMGRADPNNTNVSPLGDVQIGGNGSMAAIGWSIARLGDFDDDGIEDFALGSPFDDVVHVMSGKTSWTTGPLSSDSQFTGIGWFGASIAGGHDVTGDYVPDLVIGAPFDNGTHGKVHVLAGGRTPGTVAFTVNGSCVDANRCQTEHVGYTVAIGPDIDGDGFADVIVGSKYGGASAGAVDRGRVATYPVPSYGGVTSVPSTSSSFEVTGEDEPMGMCIAIPGSPIYTPPPG